MAPSELLFYPSSLSPARLGLGSLLSDPFAPSPETFAPSHTPSFRDLEDSYVQSSYKDTITRSSDTLDAQDAFDVEADEMTYRRLRQATQAFESLCKDSETLSYIRKNARTDRPLYFVTGLQELRNANVTAIKTPADSPGQQTLKLPVHVRRDSGTDSAGPEPSKVFGLEIREVRARVSRPDEPHSLDDIGFQWSYIPLDDDVQLAIGLGDVVNFREPSDPNVRDNLSDSSSDEDFGYMVELED